MKNYDSDWLPKTVPLDRQALKRPGFRGGYFTRVLGSKHVCMT